MIITTLRLDWLNCHSCDRVVAGGDAMLSVFKAARLLDRILSLVLVEGVLELREWCEWPVKSRNIELVDSIATGSRKSGSILLQSSQSSQSCRSCRAPGDDIALLPLKKDKKNITNALVGRRGMIAACADPFAFGVAHLGKSQRGGSTKRTPRINSMGLK